MTGAGQGAGDEPGVKGHAVEVGARLGVADVNQVAGGLHRRPEEIGGALSRRGQFVDQPRIQRQTRQAFRRKGAGAAGVEKNEPRRPAFDP
jgi:hypothetical protein